MNDAGVVHKCIVHSLRNGYLLLHRSVFLAPALGWLIDTELSSANPMATSGAPFAIEDLLASAVEALKVQGDARAIAVLLAGNCQLVPWESDFGIDYWRLFVALPIALFYAMDDEERSNTADAIAGAIRPFFVSAPGDDLNRVVITPQVVAAEDGWRERALSFIKGEGVTNQGRVRSDNIAAVQHSGLLFRSRAEVMLFGALMRARLAVAPLPVFIRIGKTYNRLEPDFVIVYRGLTFVVEVDGDTYHKELPAEADKRLVPLTYEGVEVRRIRASDLIDDAAADQAVRDLVDFMSRRKQSR